MKTVLVVGVETVAGANAAIVFAPKFHVVGLTATEGISIDGCDVRPCVSHDPATIGQLIQHTRPSWIVFCGAASRSTWDHDRAGGIDDGHACTWARIASDAQIDFTFLSSDAVFSGPWISHPEDDDHFCTTPHAARIRQVEEEVLAAHPEALVVRTNVFGWGADQRQQPFAERVMSQLAAGQTPDVDFTHHASPILATDLANLLLSCQEEGVTGLLHLAGGERTNPFDFAERLAQACEYARPALSTIAALTEPISGFGRGETTLDCSTARELLGIRLPMIDDGIRGLLAQMSNGHRQKLTPQRQALGRAA